MAIRGHRAINHRKQKSVFPLKLLMSLETLKDFIVSPKLQGFPESIQSSIAPSQTAQLAASPRSHLKLCHPKEFSLIWKAKSI